MAIRTYKVILDSKNSIAPEPVFLRQGDKTGAVVIDATLMDNGAPVSIDGLTPMFKANTADGQAVIADSTGFNIVNASGGEFTYQVPNALSSVPGKIMTAYFSFSDTSGSESTFDVAFIIKKAVDATQVQADEYITIIDGTLQSLQQKIDAMNTDVQTILNAFNQGDFYNKAQTDSKDAAILTSANSYSNVQLAQKADNSALNVERKRIDAFTSLSEGSTTGDAELIDARIGYDGTAYNTLGTAIRTQVSHLNDYQTKINYVEFKNYVGEEAFEEGKYWYTNSSTNKILKGVATGNDIAVCPKIRIKANTRYSFRGAHYSYCYLGTNDDVSISKLSEYAGFTSFAYGDETCYSLITDTDCWLYMSYQTNLDYKTITVIEGKLPAKYYKYGVVFRKEINGVPVGGAWHEKIVVDKGGSGDYEDLNTAMNYVTDGDTLHWTDIILKDDEHLITKEITIPDYCCIIGESGNRDKCIVNLVPTDTSDYAISIYSAFRMNKNTVLKNFTIKGINCRYCVHSDSSNTIKDWVQTLKNMKMEHLTNTAGSWNSQDAWGGGASSGCLVTATDCIFIAHSALAWAFGVHNNVNFEKPFRHVFSKCEFYSDNYGSFSCEGLTSGTDDIVYCEDCYFSAPIYLTNSLSIKMICSGCNIQQCNSNHYFEQNSIAEFREVTEKLKNASGSKIEKGTLVAYDGDRSQVRPMTETDDASIYAGFTIGDTEPSEACTVITDGFYRYTDDFTFGTKYGVSNGKPSKTADNKVGICVSIGFIHLTARY